MIEHMTRDEQAELGRSVIADGRLGMLRERLGLSASYIAELLGVSAITYRVWERNPQTRLWTDTAAKVGRFYSSVLDQMDELSVIGVDLRDLIPIQMAAPLLGLPQEVLLSRYREAQFDAVDLGIAGLWLYRSDFQEMRRAA